MFIQNTDVNVHFGAYKDIAPENLLVTGIFFTLQGEGPFAGCPAIFVRLAGCNRGAKVGMGCEFCDTDFRFSQGKALPYQAIYEIMKQQMQGRQFIAQPLVVITGGEPMIQKNLVGFIDFLCNRNWQVQIESNGDTLLPDLKLKSSQVFLVVSPKANKHSGIRQLPDDILERADAIKFLVSADPHTEEKPNHYANIPAWATKRELRTKVWIQPMTVYKRAAEPNEYASAWDATLIDQEATAANFRHAAGLAIGYGVRFSMQQHLWMQVP